MVLASFVYNNREYVYLSSDGKIEYGYSENNKIYKNLTEQEVMMMTNLQSQYAPEIKTLQILKFERKTTKVGERKKRFQRKQKIKQFAIKGAIESV